VSKPNPEFYSSPLSRWCADELPGDFHYLDGDEVLLRHSALPLVYARETGTLRVLESKHPGEELTRAQRETFPLLATALDLLVRDEYVADASGLFVVEGRPPFDDGATIRRVLPIRSRTGWRVIGVQFADARTVKRSTLELFVRCRR